VWNGVRDKSGRSDSRSVSRFAEVKATVLASLMGDGIGVVSQVLLQVQTCVWGVRVTPPPKVRGLTRAQPPGEARTCQASISSPSHRQQQGSSQAAAAEGQNNNRKLLPDV
jgi:hypothetical protein